MLVDRSKCYQWNETDLNGIEPSNIFCLFACYRKKCFHVQTNKFIVQMALFPFHFRFVIDFSRLIRQNSAISGISM